MAVGRYTSDLEPGDVIGPIEYTLSPFVVREYCHSVELDQEYFQGSMDQIAPPTLVHLEKLRLYTAACPSGAGPHARVHYEYDATFHRGVRVGEKLRVQGRIAERSTKRGRDYLFMDIEIRAVADDSLLVSYRDTVILSYQSQGAAA
jgi:hypothetical protein